MEPTLEQLNNRETALENINQGVDQNEGVVTTQDLIDQGEPLSIPETPAVSDYNNFAQSSLDSLLQNYNQESNVATQNQDLQGDILDVIAELGGESARKQELEQEAGLVDQRKELQGIISQMTGLANEAKAIPLQIQQESIGRGRTVGGVEPIQTSRLRENAIKSLGLASIGATLQGNIALAQQNVQNALDAEFEPKRAQLQVLQQAYLFNKDALERYDKKRADELNILLSERDRVLKLQQAERQSIYDVALTAGQFGADAQTMQSIQTARSREEALQYANGFLTDPMEAKRFEREGELFKQQLANSKLDYELKKAQINAENQRQYYTKLFGGMSASEYQKYLKEEAEKTKNLKDEQQKAQAQINSAQATVATLEGLKTHKGFSKSVGSYGIARFTPFSVDKGAVAEFTGTISNLIDNMTLEKLISAKDQGATFGALSNEELRLIANSATKINTYKRTRDDGSIYFETDESVFENDLDNLIKEYENAIKLNKARLGFDEAENITLDSFFDNDDDPTAYLPIQTNNSNSSTAF